MFSIRVADIKWTSCGTYAALRFDELIARRGFILEIRTSPSVGLNIPNIKSTKVVFPEPEGPVMATVVPDSIRTFISLITASRLSS